MRVLLSWSSGKDSAWALHLLRTAPEASVGVAAVDVVGLLTTFNETVDRVAMHAVRHEVVRAQAAAAGLPLVPVLIPSPCPNEIYDARMAAAMAQARAGGVTHVAFGDLFLEDVRRYREERLAGSGIAPLFPLWGARERTSGLADTMVASGLRAIVTCVDPRQLDRQYVGRTYDDALLRDLRAENRARASDAAGRPPVDLCAENGEFHTCVVAGPMFDAAPTHARERLAAARAGAIVDRDGFVFSDVVLPDAADVVFPDAQVRQASE